MVNLDNIEKLAQIVIGILAAIALIYFSYIELMNPDLTVSPRTFWVLVVLAGSGLALKELQALSDRSPVDFTPRQLPTTHRRREKDADRDRDDRRDNNSDRDRDRGGRQ
jgi:hypothetical protein